MLKRKKQIIAKVMATTMLASTLATTFTSTVNAAEPRSTVSETTIAGGDRYKTAVEISKNYTSTSKHAIIVNGEKGIVDALTATPYASLKKAPILMTQSTTLNPDTKKELTERGIKTVDIVGGINSVSDSVKAEIEAMNITVNRIAGIDKYETSLKLAKEVDRLSGDISKIAVANGEVLADAVSVAAPAAQNKMPIILVHPTKGLDTNTKTFIDGESITNSYVIGGTSSISDAIKNTLPGTKERLSGGAGTGRQETNAAVVKKFYSSETYDNIYVTKSGQVNKADEIADALAVGVLAASNQDPVMLVGNSLVSAQKTLLEGKEVSKITKVGNGIPTASINAIKDTQEDPEATVSSVTLVNYKTIKITGKELNRIDKSKVSISGNTTSSYTANSAGTEATVEFSNAFSNGTNTVKVTSNLGTVTSHTFTYSTGISTVEATTKEVGMDGVQYLEFTVNGGQKRTIEELKALGWTVEFKSSQPIFYNSDNPSEPKTTSSTGKLKVGLGENLVFDYEVILSKDGTTLKSNKVAVTVLNKSEEMKSIESYELALLNDNKTEKSDFYSKTLLVGEMFKVRNLKILYMDNEERTVDEGYDIDVSNSNVIGINSDGTLQARAEGSSTITITIGDLTKTFDITVKNKSKEERVPDSILFSPTTVKLIKGSSINITATIKDQHGDPINVNNFNLITLSNTNTNTNIATIAPIGSINSKGEMIYNITAGETAGSCKLQLKYTDEDGKNVTKELSITVADETNKNKTYTIEIDEDSISKDYTIDRYAHLDEPDNMLSIRVKVTDNGYFLGYKDLSDLDVKIHTTSTGTKVVNDIVEADVDAEDTTKLNISAVSDEDNGVTGTAYIKLYDGTTKIGDAKGVTVKDSTPYIDKIEMNDIDKIVKTINGAEFNIKDLFDITTSGIGENQKHIVGNVTLKGAQKDVLLHIPTDDTSRAALYINQDNSISYNKDTDLTLSEIDIQLEKVSSIPKNLYEVDFNSSESKQEGKIIVRLYKGKYNISNSPFAHKEIMVDIPANN